MAEGLVFSFCQINNTAIRVDLRRFFAIRLHALINSGIVYVGEVSARFMWVAKTDSTPLMKLF